MGYDFNPIVFKSIRIRNIYVFNSPDHTSGVYLAAVTFLVAWIQATKYENK